MKRLVRVGDRVVGRVRECVSGQIFWPSWNRVGVRTGYALKRHAGARLMRIFVLRKYYDDAF